MRLSVAGAAPVCTLFHRFTVHTSSSHLRRTPLISQPTCTVVEPSTASAACRSFSRSISSRRKPVNSAGGSGHWHGHRDQTRASESSSEGGRGRAVREDQRRGVVRENDAEGAKM